MAIIPQVLYAGQTISGDAEYPLGKARNITTTGDGTGTPLEKDWVNDLWGFLQALLDAAGIEASGNPDKLGASQYLDALDARYGGLQAAFDFSVDAGDAPTITVGAGESLTVGGELGVLLYLEDGYVSINDAGAVVDVEVKGDTRTIWYAMAAAGVLVAGADDVPVAAGTDYALGVMPKSEGGAAIRTFDRGGLQLGDADDSHAVLLRAASVTTEAYNWNLPAAAPVDACVMRNAGGTDGAGSWVRLEAGHTFDDWDPDVDDLSNISSVTINAGFWKLVDDVVTWELYGVYTGTGGSVARELTIAPPVASDFSNANHARGGGEAGNTATAIETSNIHITADTAANRIQVGIDAHGNGTNIPFRLRGSYLVL
jgi:hypothetical protein